MLHAKRLELCRFVLRRDSQWRLVLDQHVKLTGDNRPPYQDDATDSETRQSLRIVADNVDTVTPLTVMQNVVGEFSWLGSHVSYAVQVLRNAFTCVAFVHLTHVVELLEKLESTDKEGTVRAEKGESSEKAPVDGSRNRTADDVTPFQKSFREAWSTITVIANKLTFVNSELGIVSDLSSIVENARDKKIVVALTIIKLMRRRIEETIDSCCNRQFPEQVYKNFGSKEPTDENSTSGLELSISRFSRELITFYGSLGIEAMAMQNWAKVFNNRLPNMINVKLDTMMEQMLDQDHDMRERVEILNQKLKVQLFDYYLSGNLPTGGVKTENKSSVDHDKILRFDI